MKLFIYLFLIGGLFFSGLSINTYAHTQNVFSTIPTNDDIYIASNSDIINDSGTIQDNNDNINTENIKQLPVKNDYVCNNNISNIVAKLLPSVVQVRSFRLNKNSFITSKDSYFNYQKVMDLHSVGSGFIISEDGYILTNHHVVQDSDSISVYIDNTEYDAELIGTDRYQDIALLKIVTKAKLQALTLKNTNQYKIGDKVIAIGNPYGLGLSVSSGIISALNRNIQGIALDNLIQIDASINKGNSGGPLFDCEGNLIGINTILYFDTQNINNGSGIGFAIPVNTISNTVDKLMEFGYIQYGWIGITGNDASEDIFKILNSKRQTGVFVIETVKNAPADKGGILVGDIIVSYAGKHVSTFNQLLTMIRNSNVGSSVDVLVLRNNKYIKLRVNVEDLPENSIRYNEINEKVKINSVEFMDMTITTIDKNFTSMYGVCSNHQQGGMYVVEVEKGGLAEYYGIEVGDIVLTINQFQLKSKGSYLSAMNDIKNAGNKEFFVIVKKKKDKKNIVLKLNFGLVK